MQFSYPNNKQALLFFLRIIGLIALFAVPYALIRVFLMDAQTLSVFDSYYFYTSKILSQLLLFFWAVKQIRKTGNYDIRKELNFSLSWNWFYGFAGMVALIFIVEPLETMLPLTPYFNQHFSNLIKLPYLSLLYIVILTPFIQEFIFRGIILRGLLRNHSVIQSLVLSTVLFSLFHTSFMQMALAIPIGLFIAYIYWQTRSLALCILLHSFNNSAAYIILLLTGKVQSLESLIANTSLYLILYLLAASAVSISLLQIYKLNDRRP